MWSYRYVDLHVRKATAFERLPRIQEVDMLFNLTTAMSETECCTREALRQVIDSSENGYILDIDLDYFSTWNPFYSGRKKLNYPRAILNFVLIQSWLKCAVLILLECCTAYSIKTSSTTNMIKKSPQNQEWKDR